MWLAKSPAEDLRLAKPDATDDELACALDVVQARGWVEALPDGLSTEAGERGHRLTRAARADRVVVMADGAVVGSGSCWRRRSLAS